MKKIKPSETLTEQAYKIIKQAIISNDVKPLEILTEENLAQQLGISRTPIRGALNQLAFEGLVEVQSGKRARVSTLSVQDAQDFQLLREVIEPLGARLAAQYVDMEEIDFLEGICYQQRQAIAENDFNHFLELDYQFHVYIAEFSKNIKLKEFMEILNSNIQRFLILANILPSTATGAVEEHLQITKALRKKEAQLAETQMRIHIQNVTGRIVK